MTSREQPNVRRLGVVLLDLPHYTDRFGLFSPTDEIGLGSLPPGFFESPATWPIPTTYAVADGADVTATLAGNSTAQRGVAGAVERLSEQCDLVIGDCGFFWAAGERVRKTRSVVVLSGLDLLPLAASATQRPIGVLTFSEAALEPLLAGSPFIHRLRIVGFSESPTWNRLADDGYGTDGEWTAAALEAELLDRVATELQPGGRLHGVGVLVIECTVIPQFGAALQALAGVPIFEIATLVTGLLAPGSSLRTAGVEGEINKKEKVS